MSTRNPVTRIREEKGLSKYALAGLLGVSLPLIHQVEQGIIKSPTTILSSLSALFGYDSAELQHEYDAWRQDLKQDNLIKIRSQKQ